MAYDRPPTDRRGLYGYICEHFGVRLPHRAFTAGHSTPLDFVRDCLLHPGDDIAAWSCRSGCKTLAASIVAAVEFAFNDGLQARVLAGSEDQAGNLYRYWQQWCGGFLAGRVKGAVHRAGTEVGGGRFEILAASQKRVRGPKVHRLFEDELDEIDPEIDTAAAGMIASAPGLPGCTRYMSTWHRVDGLMGRLIAGIPGNGVRLHKWNVWETIGRCPRERHQDGRGCRTCPLGPACLAKAREVHHDPDWPVGIAAEALGVYAVDDVTKSYLKVGAATWTAEYGCGRPSAEGLVYPEFDELGHRCERSPPELTMYRAIDWGFDCFVCLWLGVDKDDRVYLLDTYKARRATLPQHAEYIKGHRIKSVRATYCDPAGRNTNDQTGKSDVEEFRRYGIDATYTLSPRAREVANGIRTFIRDIQDYRNRKVNDMYIDDPVEPQPAEHTMDALRYFFVNRMRPREIRRISLGAS